MGAYALIANNELIHFAMFIAVTMLEASQEPIHSLEAIECFERLDS